MSDQEPRDVSKALRFWDDLIQANFHLALAPKGEGLDAIRASRERFLEGWRRSLAERDEAMAKMIACLEKDGRAA